MVTQTRCNLPNSRKQGEYPNLTQVISRNLILCTAPLYKVVTEGPALTHRNTCMHT